MAGIGVAVEELDAGGGGVIDHSLIDFAAHPDRAHRHGAVGQTLGADQEVGDDAQGFRRGRAADAAEAGDDLIEDQQDVVAARDLAQALQIADWRDDDARRAREGLDDHGGDGFGAMLSDQDFQFVGQMPAPGRLAAREGGFIQVQGVRQVIDTGQGGEAALVVFQPADGNAAKADAVIALLPADQAGAFGLPLRLLIGQGDLQGRIDPLGA
ncbi:hypothetical protein D3C80_1138070 [compost metagenome]